MPQEVSMKGETGALPQNRRRASPARHYLPGFLLLTALFVGCAVHPVKSARVASVQAYVAPGLLTERFNFSRDTFAFANELTWDYGFDSKGRWTAHARQPKPDYTLHCFLVARSTAQFFRFARFDPQQPAADEKTYRKLVRKVVN